MNELSVSLRLCKDGDIELTLDNSETVTEIKASSIEHRRIAMMVLAACDQVDSCFYSSFIGHA